MILLNPIRVVPPDSNTIREFDHLLNIHQKIASSVEHHYTFYFKQIFSDLI